MRKFLWIFLWFVGGMAAWMPLHATGWDGDVIRWKRQTWELLDKPLYFDSLVHEGLEKFLPEGRSWTTANWEGYTAYWKVRRKRLYLDKISVEFHDKEADSTYYRFYGTDTLKSWLGRYYKRGRIHARWVDLPLRLGQGKQVYYEHYYYMRNMERECILDIRKGRVERSHTYRNFKVGGLSFQEMCKEIRRRFPDEQFPEYKGKRFLFLVQGFKYDYETGLQKSGAITISIKDSVSRSRIHDPAHPLIKTFMRVLEEVYPLQEMYYVNGKVKGSMGEHWVMPLFVGRRPEDFSGKGVR